MEELLIVLVCLALNALFAAFEMAFVSVSRSELRKLAKKGSRDSQILRALRDRPERTLSILQIGITLVGALGAAVGGVGAAESLQPYFMRVLGLREATAETVSILLVVIPLTYLGVVVGELVPKTLALRNPVGIALLGARWVSLADRVLGPAVTFLEWSTDRFLRLFFKRSKSSSSGGMETTIELQDLSPSHQQYVLNLARIESKKVKDILLPWEKVNFIQSTDSMEAVTLVVFTSGHTRLPVLEGERVRGILHTKELLALRDQGATEWLSIVRPVVMLRAEDSVITTLGVMQEKRNHLAVVSHASGELLGIVTIEDILEEIVGEIYDEDDDGRVAKLLASRAKSKVLTRGPS